MWDRLISNWNQPQLLSLIVTVLVIIIFTLIVFFKLKKLKASEAPKGIVLISESFVSFFDNTFDDVMLNKLSKSRLYIFTLGVFLLIGNLVAIFGLEPIATSYSVPLTLGLATFIGIYVVGLIYNKLRFFIKFLKNPIDIIGQFTPLISISFRIYGNIIGGSTIVALIYFLAGYLWTLIPGLNNHEWFFFAPFVTPFLHLYFDLFGAVIQAYVFAMLTAAYWTNEIPVEEAEKTNKKRFKFLTLKKVKQTVY
ncbi:F0F1 ATP synthase subunit A [Mycoplasmopsis ciconiae]|uniref:F0F1 ATP synthase subunit A n=1 Tax=Mycoplasmopsis ciconiae TaxID=561067 RepID=A0ABU7MKQ7_9BACT|nr:F0F1 ATP synthase subunit A [Mycoplasmopsis ciconiae]